MIPPYLCIMDKIPQKKSKHYSRNKGHNAEREFALKFRELGYGFCKTSRQASRLLDDCGVDLTGIPFNVQIKAGYWSARPKADKLFKDMKENLKKNFPSHEDIHRYPRILIHRLDAQEPEHILVTMTWDDWVNFLKAYKSTI